MKFFTAFFLTVSIMLMGASTVLAQTVDFTASSEVIAPGATGEVDITVANFEDVSGMQLDLNWDPDVLEFVGVTNLHTDPGTDPDDDLTFTEGDFGLTNTANGTLRFLWADNPVDGESIGAPDVDTNPLLFSVEFRALGCSGGSSDVSFSGGLVFIGDGSTQGTFNGSDGMVDVTGANPVPVLDSIDPTTGMIGETLEVDFTGDDFLECAEATFTDGGITVNSSTVNSPTSLTANVTITGNASAGDGMANVEHGGTSSVTPQSFTVQYPAPVITNVNPGGQAPGTTGDVVITGTGFIEDGGNSSTVAFSGFSAGDITLNGTTYQNCTGVLCTQITANITVAGGATPATGTVEVDNPGPFGGGGMDEAAFSTGNPTPVINSVTPEEVDRGATGLSITIEGSGFVDGVTNVAFSNPGITITSGPTVNAGGDEIDLTIDVNPGADLGTGTVTVSNPTDPPPGGSDTADFTVTNPAPDLLMINPDVGDLGQTIDIILTGNDFVDDGANSSTVTFSGTGITVNSTTFQNCTGNLCNQITVNVTITSDPGVRDVSVNTPGPGGGSDIINNGFLVNTPPVAVDDLNEETDVDTPVVIDVLANDSDADGNDLDIINVSDPKGGIVAITGTAPNETITYTPDSDFAGKDTLTYTISDGVGPTNATATVIVFVDAPPTAVDDNAIAGDNNDVLIPVLDNDLSPDGETLTIISTTPPGNGTVQIVGDEIRYTPDTDFLGTDMFTYTIEDESGNQDTGTVTVNVVGNRAPIANDDDVDVDENTSVLIPVLENDTDPDGDPLSIDSIDSTPSNGTVTIVDEEIRYTPSTNFLGTDKFTYIVTDPDGLTDTGEVTVRVYPGGNTAPVAVNDAATTEAGTMVEVDVLENDSDPDGDPLTLDIVSDPANGTAVINSDVVTYTPDGGFTGIDTFTYTISDDKGATATATVTITVEDDGEDNGPPVANDDAANTTPSTAVTINVLANDTDPDDDSLTITAVSTPANGTAVISSNRVRYTPDGGFTGIDTFTYTISDGTATDMAIVTVTVGSNGATFSATLSGANEVPPNSNDRDNEVSAAKIQSGTGTVNATLNGNTLTVSGSFDNLESDFNTGIGAHIHRGFAGQNGDVVFPLNVTPDADNRGGTLSGTFTLTSAQIQDLQDRRYYVNIHTVDLPAGSVRGQLTSANADATYRVVFSGRAEVPANPSEALGSAIAERTGNTLVVSGAFSGLESDFNALIGGGAHIHQAAMGENGGIVFNLTTTLDSDDRGGVFEPTENTFTLTNDQVDALEDDLFYVNIHTTNLTGGELRGQVLPESNRVFEFWLSGQNEVPALETSASGGGIAVLEGSTLRVAGSFRDLESNFNAAVQGGAHLHGAPVGENGGIVFDLNTEIDTDQRGGTFVVEDNTFTLTGDELAMLLDGNLYVNIHSVDQAAGELRGQVLLSTNVAPEAATLTTPTDGLTIDIMGDPGDLFEVAWSEATDPNGNAIVYRWQLAQGSDFEDVLFEAPVLTETGFSVTYGEVAALLTANGVELNGSMTLYHRVVTSDGSLSTEGQAFTVRLTRGTITANEEADDLPTAFALHGNFPNPFNPSTTIRFDLPESAEVRVEVIDILGRRVMEVGQQQVGAGSNRSLQLDASRLASGTYLYRIVAQTASETMVETGRMTLIK